jgi:hypothetical protein
VIGPAHAVERILLQLRRLRHRADGPDGGPAQLRDPLRQEIRGARGVLDHLVEQFVEGNEAWSANVPVRLLGLELQVDGIGQAPVENIHQRRTCPFGRSFFV